jgi:hypothetical protein
MMRIKSSKGILDSDAKWLETAKTSKGVNMSKAKFEDGDKVRIRSAQIDCAGIVKSYCDNGSFGMSEYEVDFNGKTHYCYEAELVLDSRRAKNTECECGADKTYGENAPNAYHALYCPARKGENV